MSQTHFDVELQKTWTQKTTSHPIPTSSPARRKHQFRAIRPNVPAFPYPLELRTPHPRFLSIAPDQRPQDTKMPATRLLIAAILWLSLPALAAAQSATDR